LQQNSGPTGRQSPLVDLAGTVAAKFSLHVYLNRHFVSWQPVLTPAEDFLTVGLRSRTGRNNSDDGFSEYLVGAADNGRFDNGDPDRPQPAA